MFNDFDIKITLVLRCAKQGGGQHNVSSESGKVTVASFFSADGFVVTQNLFEPKLFGVCKE